MPYGPAARVTDLTSHGSPLAPGVGSTNVLIGSMPAWRALMDFHACPIVKGVVPDVGVVAPGVGAPAIPVSKALVASLASMPAAAAAQRQALIDAAKGGVPFCE